MRQSFVTSTRRAWATALAVLALAGLGGCGYNDFQRLDEQVKAAWSEVLNQYQRRADLIPNIVSTVKGEANFEQETLTRVVEARVAGRGLAQFRGDPALARRFLAWLEATLWPVAPPPASTPAR